MNIIYPESLLNKNKVDEVFEDEFNSLRVDHNCFIYNEKIKIPENGIVLFRGWMLSKNEYEERQKNLLKRKLKLFTNLDQYYLSHYIQNWYNDVKDYTPKTIFFTNKDDLLLNLSRAPFKEYFVKDSVKSLTTSRGSIAHNSEELFKLIDEFEKFKNIEGLIVLREVHSFIEDSEVRYFSINGIPFSPNGYISPLAKKVANIFKNIPFISIDIILDKDGKEWLVEIGDGQVSDLKMWGVFDFSNMLKQLV